ncbi:amino acid:proton symporter, ABT family [Archaeoglobus sulfaticallidus PM70-1]|uniref:Amino acid:proton symporter, ABT family n=1 Tax=Archaeoglobus sulfaticallidus PM70-1 TaxID=387631 RepID=N0BF09_9EURY|nr:amino acid permease [Archaeoglobus sulfaticallidus]AGK61603.1 amino acid:proton symporter, ABT family [Archaeoglobus sulfaticallidus PM70-1]
MRKKIGFWEAFSIGVGGMIGGGIFAVLGLSIQLSKSAAPVAFLLAGLIALATAYSYARLSVRFPSEGGTIEFIVRAYGTGLFSGTLNVLLLASYIVMLSLYAYAFGSYGANMLGFINPILAKHLLITLVIVLFTVVNALGAVISGKTEDLLVVLKLAILLIVAGAGMAFVDTARLSPSNWADPVSIVAGGMIIFLAYEGFELIANTGSDVEDPSILPKAFYAAVLLVVVVYVMVAVVTVGNLPYDMIIKARDYALAAAAKPSLGEAGFWLITLAALASTSSAINATLYGTVRASYMVAKYGQLPEAVEKPLWKQAYEGLLIISLLSLIFANTASLEFISTAGSGGFLLIFLFVNIAALKLRDCVKLNPVIPAVGTVLTLAALVVLIYRMAETDVRNLTVFVCLIAASFLIEASYRAITSRKIEEYLDVRLRKREENLENWYRWIDGVICSIVETFEDAEVYLVGSIARGDIKKANDVDLLIFTNNLPSKDREKDIVRKLKQKAKLTLQHSVDIHFANKQRKEETLREAQHYKLLKRSK